MRPKPLTLGVLIAIAVVAGQALLIPLFAAPAANLAPRDLPLAVAGPPQLAAQLEAQHPGAFEITQVADPAAADLKIKDRAVYGAIVVTASGPEVHVASAASPTVARLLTQAAAGLGATAPPTGSPGSGGGTVPVRDVVPVDPDDPLGAGFGAGFLPLAITSLLAGVLVYFLVPRRGARLAALVTFGALAGLAGAAVQVEWLGILPDHYLAVAGSLGLFALAVSAAMTGLAALAGRAGLALGAVVMFLVGNALSGIAAAPELLPQPWGAVGQWLPIGAGGTLLRSAAYFDGHGGRLAVTVLSAYAIGGLILVLIGRDRIAGRTEVVPVEAAPELAGAH
ncbi:hypothetical protein ODJ79_23730 [Actinoplanes sp. KI2]|uniref:hypothetical protein n=1 Tax=Actinoplanes sp. KI2 TaxID=2983315 RepID=UPI0021D5CBC2|nr:hypothetical protein [Actinoplanes sp. KI2]MCU7726752.1 hypothetical protein [Actinoplanes sp. KI2]